MRLVYKGNVLNFHTYPLAEQLYKLLGDDFVFITDTKSETRGRGSIGREDCSLSVPWAINTNLSSDNKRKAREKIDSCDVLLTLEAYNRDYWKRMKENKMTFFYSERLFKPSMLKPYNPKMAAAMVYGHTRFRNKNSFMLCNSAYLPADLSLYGAYPKKLYKWGYFPETRYYKKETLIEKKAHSTQLLWVGGMSQDEWWKHPELAIDVMRKLEADGIDAHLTVVGDGELRHMCEKAVKHADIEHRVTFTGKLNNQEVVRYMLESNIYLFTSDYEEGWGVVLNEAMNQGCAVVASHAAGATPFLIEHGKNGMIFKSGDAEDLYHKVKMLIGNRDQCIRIGIEAYNTIADTWNAQNAAVRFVELCDGFLKGNPVYYQDGPCSLAAVIKQGRMYDVLADGMEKR